MARAFIRLAAVATCIALSLTAEDRQARSGDLDRGPSFEEGAHQWSHIKKRNSVIYLDNVRESNSNEPVKESFYFHFGNDQPRERSYLLPLNNLRQNIFLPNGERKPDRYYNNAIFLTHGDPSQKHYHKEISNKRTESQSQNSSKDLNAPKGVHQEDKLKSHNQFRNVDFNNEGKLKVLKRDLNQSNQLAESNIDILHLVYKEPVRKAGVIPLLKTIPLSIEPRKRQMRSENIFVLGTKIPLGKDLSEISFENTNGEAMPLKRHMKMSTEFFLIPSSSTPATSTSGVHITKAIYPEESDKIGGIFRNEVWVIPVIALSAVTMCLIAGFEIFVLCKAWRTTPSRRHLFLGQMLLLGLFSCAGLASVVAASPTQFTCALMRFGTGVAYAMVFSSLLVKCVFLISLNGGVYLPAPYQGLLLLFAILIQVAIGVQWLLTSPPLIDTLTVEQIIYQNRNRLLVTAADISTTEVITLCRTPYVDMVLSLIYIIFLIIFVTVLSIKSRRIRDNYREATYIGLSVGCSIPTWLIWTVSGLFVSERHKDASIAFGLIIISTMVFLIMFMPKGRQLAAMGKEGVYVEDREERFSSLSRTGSGYSPSFFHFKPIKYGINQGTKNQQIPTLGGGGMYDISVSFKNTTIII